MIGCFEICCGGDDGTGGDDDSSRRNGRNTKNNDAFVEYGYANYGYDDGYYYQNGDGDEGGGINSGVGRGPTSSSLSSSLLSSAASSSKKASLLFRLLKQNSDEEDYHHGSNNKEGQDNGHHDFHNHRRPSFFSSPLDVDEVRCFNCQKFPKTDEEYDFIKQHFKQLLLFDELSDEELDEVISAMEKIQVTNKDKGKDKEIIQLMNGDNNKCEDLLLIQSGELVLHEQQDLRRRRKPDRQQRRRKGSAGGQDGTTTTTTTEVLKRGDLYGEMNLLCGPQHRNSATSMSSLTVSSPTAVVWKLNQGIFRHVVAKHSLKQDTDILTALRQVKLFQSISSDQSQLLTKFANALVRVTYHKDDRIVNKGDIGDVFYIIENGQVQVHDIGIGDSQPSNIILGNGDSFGERSLLTGEPRAANVTAISDNVTTFAMDRRTFEEHIGQLQDILDFPSKVQAIKGLPIFANSNNNISEIEFERMAELTVEVCYKKGSKLFQNGQPYPPYVWMIRSGQVIVYGSKSTHIYNFQTGDYLGDKSILNPDEHISSHDATCETNVDAWVLTRDDIQSVIVDLKRLGNTAGYLDVKRESLTKIGMHELTKLKILGQGGFGKVWLVQSKRTDDVYALKIINKRRLLESKQERSVLREKEMLALLHHPFILHMVSSFQDESYLYLVLPVIQGGELFSVVSQKRKGLPVYDAAFYGIGIIEALGHFHHRYIAYRDLKLENVMIDADGYIRIVDLGFSKVILDKSYTFCGTPDYVAPEIIMSKGHSYPVDYWSFGVLLFEMLAGRSPFSRPNQPQLQMFRRIVMMDYNLPYSMDENAKDLIERLLQRNVTIRLGVQKNGYRDIRDHKFFQDAGVDWKKIMNKDDSTTKVPWKPKVVDPLDTRNFDTANNNVDHEVPYGTKLSNEEQAIFADF